MGHLGSVSFRTCFTLFLSQVGPDRAVDTHTAGLGLHQEITIQELTLWKFLMRVFVVQRYFFQSNSLIHKHLNKSTLCDPHRSGFVLIPCSTQKAAVSNVFYL